MAQALATEGTGENGRGPMNECSRNALVSLQAKLKLFVIVKIGFIDQLPKAAGGFLNQAEVQAVVSKTVNAEQMGELIQILIGKGNEDFGIFCRMLRESNYSVWADELEKKARKLKAEADGTLSPHTAPPPAPGSAHAAVGSPDQKAEDGCKPTVSTKPTRMKKDAPAVLPCPEQGVRYDKSKKTGEPHRPVLLGGPANEMTFDDLDVEDLHQVLEKELGAEIATVIRDQDTSGQDFLDLTEADVANVFSKMGQVKKVLRLIKAASAHSDEVAAYMEQTGSAEASASLLFATKEDSLLNPAITRNETPVTPLAGLGSQTKPIEQEHRRQTPKAVVPPLPQKRLALQAKEVSKCIHKGRQSIYVLKLKPEADGKAKGVAKYRFGEPRPDSQEYVVMLVGATGAGKTTLINGIANYILGVEWEDDFRFKLITEEGGGSQAHSQTSSITAYTITHQQGSPFPHNLTLVHTPGFGDTKGLDSDKDIVEQIRAFFSMPGQKGIDRIHGIGFVIPASQARLTHTQRYVFDSILSVLGVDIGKNILMMTTFADAKKPPVREAVDEAGIGYCMSFKFNNSALFTDETSGDQEVEAVSFHKMFWDMGMACFKTFFVKLSRMDARSLQLTKEVLEERMQLEAIMQSFQLQIQAISTLQQEEQIMEQHKALIAANRNFNYTVTEQKIVKRKTRPGQHVTNCVICNFTCHKDCDFGNNDDKQRCCAMSGEHCTICNKKCHWTSHVNNPFWFETETVTVEKTYGDLKKRYEAALAGKTTKESVVGMIRSEIAASYHEVKLMTRKAQQIRKCLDDIALRPNSLSEVEYIDLLIQSEQNECRDGFMQRIQCLRTVRKQAELLFHVKDGVLFEGQSLKLLVGLFKKTAKSA